MNNKLERLISSYNGAIIRYRNNSLKGYIFKKGAVVIELEPAFFGGFERKLKNGTFKHVKHEYKITERGTKNCYALTQGSFNGIKYESIKVETGFHTTYKLTLTEAVRRVEEILANN